LPEKIAKGLKTNVMDVDIEYEKVLDFHPDPEGEVAPLKTPLTSLLRFQSSGPGITIFWQLKKI
jgi:hypothetical protein